jgi:hypothetical protein
MLETDRMALRGLSFPDETKGFRVDIGNDEAGRADRAIIRIQEGRPEYHEIFSIFCADILAHWGSHSIAAVGNRALVRRLDGWKRFFQRGAQAGLSREDYIGLYGELSFIDAALSEGLEPGQLLAAWQAPFGTNQDFLFGPTTLTPYEFRISASWIRQRSIACSSHDTHLISETIVAQRFLNS